MDDFLLTIWLGNDKLEPQTTSHMVEASIISPASGNKEHSQQASQILYNFASQLKPLCNLDK